VWHLDAETETRLLGGGAGTPLALNNPAYGTYLGVADAADVAAPISWRNSCMS
jgi:hypothetical protein